MRCPNCAQDGPGDANFCGACGTRLRTVAPRDGVRETPLTVLFCDIVGSTALSTRLDVEDWHEVVVEYQRVVDDAVAARHGRVIRYLGDGVLACFGHPAAQENDSVHAVRAALAIVANLKPLNADLTERLGVSLSVRIGIHSGGAAVAAIDHGAVSDLAFRAVASLAARLEAVAPENGVVVSDATHHLVEGAFSLESMGSHVFRGFQDAIGVHLVTGTKDDHTATRHAQDQPVPR